MESGFFFTVFYQPVYNGLVFLIDVVPGGNLGVSIILLTVGVRFLLLPLSHKATVSQSKLRLLAPHLDTIKENFKDDKQLQAQKTLELYREHGINPFSGCFLLLLQLPIIFALYWVFFKGLPDIDPEILYSFVGFPEAVGIMFLGITLTAKSFVLALLAAITQYFQIKLSLPPVKAPAQGAKQTFKDDFARSFNMQMRYILPVVVFIVSYSISAAIALYWATSNLFSIIHELYVKKKSKEI